jgi:hypothetical protein
MVELLNHGGIESRELGTTDIGHDLCVIDSNGEPRLISLEPKDNKATIMMRP